MLYPHWQLLVPLTAAVLATIAAPASAAADAKAFYVSPSGSDAAAGSPTTPFQTIPAAQASARTYHAAHPDVAVTVHLRAGVYPLADTLRFEASDSNTTYVGDGAVTISGGDRINGWKNVGGNRWVTTLPDAAGGKRYFEQLFVGDARRYRPRMPKQGYYYSQAAFPAVEKAGGKGYDRFQYAPGEIHADWYDLPHVQVLPFHIWEMSRFPIASVDDAAHTVTFAGRTIGDQSFTDLSRGRRYVVENVREALTDPGEWYLDAAIGQLTYLAKPGENLRTLPVIAPRLSALVTVTGATNLVFRHLAFAHSAYVTPPTGHSIWQAESDIDAAVTVTAGDSVRFDRCAITHTGGYGIWFRAGSKRCALTGSILADLGAGGVKIGETDIPKTPAYAVSENVITDCRIEGGGRVHPAAIGVWIGQSSGNQIEHNAIVDFYYTGISVGWTWGYGASAAHDNAITKNVVRQIGQSVLSDMGGIYTLGVSPGTTIDGNVFLDIHSFDYGGWGIYFDEGTSGVIAQDNTVSNVKSSAFHQHYGKDNALIGNRLFGGADGVMVRTRAEDHLSFTAKDNVLVAAPQSPLLGGNWTGTSANFRLDGNHYSADHNVIFPGNRDLTQWQQTTGQDLTSDFSATGSANDPGTKQPAPPTDPPGPRPGALTDLPEPPITPAFPPGKPMPSD